MLSMLEEVVLLAIDEQTGKLRSTKMLGTAYALGGALFFDLALAKKIDTGTSEIEIIDTASSGNATMDFFLGEMAKRPERDTVRGWIREAFGYKDYLEEQALQSLISRGVLRHEKTRRLWMIDVERFPLVDNQPLRHVKLRLAQAILTDAIPDTRDIMLVSIAEPCGLLEYVLSEAELANREARINTLCHLETISREVREAILFVDQNIKTSMHTGM